MQILGTGDWHYGYSYDDDLDASVENIAWYCEKISRPDLIIIVGDLYHAESRPESRRRAIAAIQRLATFCRVLIVKGNHEVPGDINLLNHIKAANEIIAMETPGVILCEDTAIYAFPWVTKAAWMKSHPDATKEDGDKSVSQLALDYLQNAVGLYKDKRHSHVLATHMMIQGARLQNNQPFMGEGVTLGHHDLAEAGFDYAIAGHIHLQQTFGNGNIFYPGSIAALDYGESPEKFFSVIDTNDKILEFIPLKTIDRFSINAEVVGNGLSDNRWMPTDCDMTRIAGARVRVNLRIEDGLDAAFIKSQIAEQLSSMGALEVKINPQILPKEQIRVNEIATAQTLPDKLRCYWESVPDARPDQDTQTDMLEKLGELEEGECCLKD